MTGRTFYGMDARLDKNLTQRGKLYNNDHTSTTCNNDTNNIINDGSNYIDYIYDIIFISIIMILSLLSEQQQR